MSDWGREIYGDPCRECGFAWSATQAELSLLVAGVPQRLRALLGGKNPTTRHADLGWSAGAYVCHLGDNLHIYGERLAGIALGAAGPLAPYDQDEFAAARHYELIPIESALWSVDHAAAEWLEAAERCDSTATVEHPERGLQTALDLMRSSAHDAHHHVWDVRRTLAGD